jgi:hypothetical protein
MSGARLAGLLARCRRNGLEVWRMDGATARKRTIDDRRHGAECAEPWRAGWYWWACFPGCLPDGDPMGPFTSPTRAAEDAVDGLDDEVQT